MKTIKILGMGCPNCKTTEAHTQEAIKKLGIDARIEKVEDPEKIMAYHIMTTPALVIDEEVKIKGRVPQVHEIIELLSDN